MIDNLFSYIVLLALIGLYIWRQVIFDRREQDLLTRLMSKTVGEYAEATRRLRMPAPVSSVTVAEAIDKLAEEGISAEEAQISQRESDHVRIS